MGNPRSDGRCVVDDSIVGGHTGFCGFIELGQA